MAKIDLESFPTSPQAKRMLDTITGGFYDKSYVGKWLFQVMGLEFDELARIVDELPDQLMPETATWGLMWHEIKWQLPVRENLSYEERRRLIYMKRDFKAPMTPVLMEDYLAKAFLDFEVTVADIHDPGVFGWHAPHPNVFKVFMTSHSTLDVKAAMALICKLKQSHTTFTLNDRRNVDIDERGIEKFKADQITFGMKIYFWGIRMFDGSWLFDGEYLMDAARRYRMEIGLMHGLKIRNPREKTDPGMELKLSVREHEKMKPGLVYGFSFFFWPYFYFDGTWKFDGDRLMNARFIPLPETKLKLGLKVEDAKEQYEDWKLEKHSKNYWLFDGSVLMDGSRKFDSIYREEEI